MMYYCINIQQVGSTFRHCCCPWTWSLAFRCPRGQISSPWPWPWSWAKVLGLSQKWKW